MWALKGDLHLVVEIPGIAVANAAHELLPEIMLAR